jgi:hypothetical protein
MRLLFFVRQSQTAIRDTLLRLPGCRPETYNAQAWVLAAGVTPIRVQSFAFFPRPSIETMHRMLATRPDSRPARP